MQISSAIKNLRKNIIQADNNKLKAEKELKLINTDFSKEQKYQLQWDVTISTFTVNELILDR